MNCLRSSQQACLDPGSIPGSSTRHIMRNRAGYRMINDRCILLLGLIGFDSMLMVKGGFSGQINGKSNHQIYNTQRLAA